MLEVIILTRMRMYIAELVAKMHNYLALIFVWALHYHISLCAHYIEQLTPTENGKIMDLSTCEWRHRLESLF